MNAGANKNYLLGLLAVMLAFNYVERLALGLLLQDIKTELVLSDVQLGLLTGIAFALFYSVLGIPIARWADRGNRVAIISLAAALSGIAVILCGVAGTFIQLLVIRVFVGVGEAGHVPPTHSLLADYFDRTERARALGIYKLGVPLSLAIGYFGAGWLNELYGWRTTFMLVGVPNLVLALLAVLTLTDPRRRLSLASAAGHPAAASTAAAPSVLEVLRTLWANKTFRHLLLAYAVASFFSSGIGQWKPAFFIRSWGLSSQLVGMWFAATYGIAGFIGTYWGGKAATRHASGNERLQLRVMGFLYCAFGLISACIYISPNPYIALAFMFVATLGVYMAVAPIFAMIQSLVPDRMRAMAVAIVFLFANLVGLGLGPLAVGALSDALQPWAGKESLRYALLMLSPGYLWCAWHLWRASRTVNQDVDSVSVSKWSGDDGTRHSTNGALSGS